MAGLNALFRSSDDDKVRAWINVAGSLSITQCYDCDGYLIRWSEYGVTTQCGWEIDHAIPTALGGFDVGHNYRARHWHGNRSAGGRLGNSLSNTR